MRARWIVPAVIVVVAFGLAVLEATLGGSPAPEAHPTGPPPTGGLPPAGPHGTPSPGSIPSGFAVFRDPQAGFSVALPASWQRLDSADPQIALVATPNGRDSVLVRVVPMKQPVGDDLAQARERTAQLVLSSPDVRLLVQPARVNVAGLPGWFYFYTFQDATSGQRGAHSHYFLFRDKTMYVIVLQALPADGFEGLADTFDHVVNSFQTVPRAQPTES